MQCKYDNLFNKNFIVVIIMIERTLFIENQVISYLKVLYDIFLFLFFSTRFSIHLSKSSAFWLKLRSVNTSSSSKHQELKHIEDTIKETLTSTVGIKIYFVWHEF